MVVFSRRHPAFAYALLFLCSAVIFLSQTSSNHPGRRANGAYAADAQGNMWYERSSEVVLIWRLGCLAVMTEQATGRICGDSTRRACLQRYVVSRNAGSLAHSFLIDSGAITAVRHLPMLLAVKEPSINRCCVEFVSSSCSQ